MMDEKMKKDMMDQMKKMGMDEKMVDNKMMWGASKMMYGMSKMMSSMKAQGMDESEAKDMVMKMAKNMMSMPMPDMDKDEEDW